MNLTHEWLFAFLCVFIRCTAMLLAAPMTPTAVPTNIRVLVGAAVAFAASVPLMTHIGPPPADLVALILAVLREAITGFILGMTLQVVAAMVEAAGTLSDLQMGLANAQVFNPVSGGAATPIARFKFMLAIVLIFSSDAHHLMFSGLVKSYSLGAVSPATAEHLQAGFVSMIGQLFVAAMMIGAPVAALGLLIDIAAGVVNKAVPQTQPFLLALPVKLSAGMLVLAVGLPSMIGMIKHGVEIGFGTMLKALGGA
ncbi:MAG: flagellar biosynthetic protein FliR [Fimbriimonadaceae bacterium]|nr:flagellar biosynthetic protein FliR [Fimbriimonadaceae bacterium]